MSIKRCPSEEALHEFATKPDAARIREHLLHCDTCRRMLEEICQDEELLREMRQAGADTLSEQERARVLKICRSVAADEKEPRRPAQ
jgi:predicted anti-sigma-YlaC factor YlaD